MSHHCPRHGIWRGRHASLGSGLFGVEPSQIQASINVRQRHLARISVDYSPFGFLIRYRDSQGLEYEDGKIHRNYNRWVNSLRAEILHQLKLPKTL